MGSTSELRATLVVSIHNYFQGDPANCHLNCLEGAVDSDEGAVDSSSVPRNVPSNETMQLIKRKDVTLDDLRPYTTRLEKYLLVVEDPKGDYPPWKDLLLLEVTSQMPKRLDYELPLSLAAELLAGTAKFVPNEAERNDSKIYTELMRRAMAAVCLVRNSGKNVQMYKQDRIKIDDENMRVRVTGTDRMLSVSPFDPYRNRNLSPIMDPKAAKAVLSKEVRF